MSNKSSEEIEKELQIEAENYTLYDKILYGGFGYDSSYCFPTHTLKIIATILFPPMSFIFKHKRKDGKFPYINFSDMMNDINELIYILFLVMLFYLPGLIYSLELLKKCDEDN